MAFTKLHETNITSSTSLVTMDNIFDDTFDTYEMFVNQYGSSVDNKNLRYQLIHDDGNTNTDNDYRYGNYFQYSEGGYFQQYSNGTSIGFAGYATTAEQASGQFQLNGFRTANSKFVLGKSSGTIKGTYTYHYGTMYSTMINDTRKVRGLKFFITSGNIRSLRVRIYGVS